MRDARRVPMLGLAVALLALASCRPMSIQTDPGPAYALEVRNPMPHAMIVSYDDGTGQRLLGTVSGNAQAEFVITAPARQTIEVSGTDEDRTHAVRRTVTLQIDAPARVTLSN
jgi:hypothetical protein